MSASTERAFTDGYGVRIVFDHYPAATEPRAVVQLLHGVGEHAGRYAHLIAELVSQGYIVYADDHRGHGRTGLGQHDGDHRRLGKLGRGGMPATKAACWQFSQLIRDENPDLPLVLIGQSWGSILAQMLLDEHAAAYDAVALSASALRTPGSMNSGDLNAPWKGPGAMGTEWLSSDLAVGRAFLDDPLTTTDSVLKLFGPIDGLRLFGRPARNLARDVPVLLMVGRDDTLGGPRSVHRRASPRGCLPHAVRTHRCDDARLPRRATRDLQRRLARRGRQRPRHLVGRTGARSRVTRA